MKINRKSLYLVKSLKPLCLLGVGGALAGFCNGLLGAGGGIILVLVLSYLLPSNEENSRSVYANALLVMFPLSCLTLWRYIQGGALEGIAGSASSVWFFAGSALGGIAGGFLLGKLKNRQTRRLFAVLTLISGILMITK